MTVNDYSKTLDSCFNVAANELIGGISNIEIAARTMGCIMDMKIKLTEVMMRDADMAFEAEYTEADGQMSPEVKQAWEIFIFKIDNEGFDYAMENYRLPSGVSPYFDSVAQSYDKSCYEIKCIIKEAAEEIGWEEC